MRRRPLSTLKESMLEGQPFPKLHTKAAETKSLVEPVAAVVRHLRDRDPSQQGVVDLMLDALDSSRQIDVLVDSMTAFKVQPQQADELQALVQRMNAATAKLCHAFTQRGVFLFNFIPKHHYLFHLAQLGRHMSPKLAWCYQGEDLMQKVKVLAQGSFRGTPPRILGNKILGKYLVGLSHALSEC